MPLTERQRIALSKLTIEDQLEIIDAIVEYSALLNVKEYSEATGLNTREVYRLIKKDKVYFRQISGLYFISLIPKVLRSYS